MSWIDEELRRREGLAARKGADENTLPGEAGGGSILTLWDRLEAANSALPEALQLRRDARKASVALPGTPVFLVWLVAPNGAALGLTADGIRYVWPKENRASSHNFWIHCDAKKGYRLVRRVGPVQGQASTAERSLDEAKLDKLLRCLVTNTRVDYKAITRGWLRSLFQ